jgi:hypothetical protein
LRVSAFEIDTPNRSMCQEDLDANTDGHLLRDARLAGDAAMDLL